MTLELAARLGPYEITGKLGEGGMGEVYRATDSRLKREVAIKVLPAAFAADRERVARFEREAQVLAQLQHPNIAAIYGYEESDGALALVMELVEGEDLAERLARGPLPVEDAIAIARQIAEALEVAHEQGTVHRDLKPSNVKVRPDGTVKVLDFGLAKAMEPPRAASAVDLALSPTLTAAHGTQLGVILGTAAYMAPEQARGAVVDRRADIWAFGVVLWEMLTGRRLFGGETVSDTLAAVLREPVDLDALPADTPPSVRRLVARCLERNPRLRLRDIGEARIALDGASAEPLAAPALIHAPARTWAGLLPWMLLLAVLGAAGWGWWSRSETAAPAVVSHLELGLPPEIEPIGFLAGAMSVSPDGRKVGLIGVRDGRRRLYVRQLDQSAPLELTDPSGFNAATFSPDSASIAFVGGNAQVTRLSLVDQQRAVLATGADLDSSLWWGPSGVCFMRGGALWIVPASGGAARQLTKLDASRHEMVHSDPLMLPDGRTVLFSSMSSEPGADRIEAVSVDGGARSVIVDHASGPVWSPSGHLLFGRDGSVLAASFDPRHPRRVDAAVPVLSAGQVGTLRWGSLAFRVSSTGTLVVVPPEFDAKRLVAVQGDGSEKVFDLPAGSWSTPRVSPDGKHLLLTSASSTVESLDLARGTKTVLDSAAFATGFPAWTSDGRLAVFRRFGMPYWVAADGGGRSSPVPGVVLNDYPSAAGPEPDLFLGVRIDPVSSADLYLFSVSGRAPPKVILSTPAYEGGPQLSPDGRWLVHQSNATGQAEIYVRRFPAMDRAWQVSENGGVQPRWSADGHAIHYRDGKHVVAVSFDGSRDEPGLGRPTPLFADEFDFGPGLSVPNYDVTADGRFLMFRRTPAAGRVRVVLGWSEELKRLVAAGGVR